MDEKIIDNEYENEESTPLEEEKKEKEENEAVNAEETKAEDEDTPDEDAKKKHPKEEKKQKSRIAALEKELEELKKKADETNDKYMRIMAEYDNFRKRSQKEKESIYSDAVADSVKELLPLFDNLERASGYEESDKLAEGLRMILKTVPDVLSKMKVESFGAAGESFDPNIHNAIMHEENEEYGENEIVDVFQKGYRVGDKIIRHAMVKVAN